MAAGNGTPEHQRATRRQFFRVFGRQTVSGANNVLSGVDSLRRTSQEALGDLLGDEPDTATTPEPVPLPAPAEPYRSPFRFTGHSIELLDQRQLPARAPLIECRAPSEVASALRQGLVSGGPVVGQLAAYCVVAAVARSAAQAGSAGGRAALDAAIDTLRPARPTSRALSVALGRMGRRAELVASDDGAGLVAALTDEADAIAAEAAGDHSLLGQHGVEALHQLAERAAEQDRPMELLLHGDQGPLVGGQVGLGVTLLQQLAARGFALHAWLTEAAPLAEGRRAAWQLAHLGVPHTLVPDTALGWLLANRRVDALLLRAETVLADGAVVAPLGSLVAAREARAAGPIVGVCAPLVACAESTATPDLPGELRLPAPDPAHGPRLDPAADLLPAELIDVLLTDEGPLRPPFAGALSAALGAREARHAALRHAGAVAG